LTCEKKDQLSIPILTLFSGKYNRRISVTK